MTAFFLDSLSEHHSATEAVRAVLDYVATAAQVGVVAQGAGVLKGGTREALGLGFVLSDPRARISGGPFPLNLPVATARFVWMMSASNRLADIAFYEPKVEFFSDDGVIVPGSSYGARMLQSAPGLNQLEGVIATLRSDPYSRRAAITIYHPMDAIRESKDIPCTFGLLFHLRDGRLLSQVVMRSNNAFGLLPFNLFEFSMVAEVIAAELDVECGEMLHHAASMHVYDRDLEKVGAAFTGEHAPAPAPMDPMPRNPGPLAEINALVKFESEMRHGSAGIDGHTVGEWMDRATSKLSPYWRQFAFLLLWAAVARRGDRNGLVKVEQVLKPAFRASLPKARPVAGAPAVPQAPEMAEGLFARRQDANVLPLMRPGLEAAIRQRAEAYEQTFGERIGGALMLDVRAALVERLAARGNEEALSAEDFAATLEGVRDRRGT